MKSKRIIAVLTVGALLFSLSACGTKEQKNEETTKTENRKVKITYLSRHTNPEVPRDKVFIDKLNEFCEAHPDVEVEDLSVTEPDAYTSKIKSLIASGSTPDLFISSNVLSQYEMAKNGTVSDLTPIIESEEWTGPTDENILSGFNYSDKGLEGQYGIPNSIATFQMFVNTAIFDELGLEIPETWEDMEAITPVLAEHGIIPISFSGKDTSKAIIFFTMLGVKMHGMDFQKKFMEGTVSWEDPEIVDVVEKFEELVGLGTFGENAVSYSADDCIANFEQKKAAMLFDASYIFSRVQQMEISKNVICVNIFGFEDKPEYKDIWYTNNFEGFSVGAKPGTPEYDVAAELLSFLMSQETYNQYAEVEGGGAFPVEVEVEESKVKNVVGSFMEAYASHTDVISIVTTYLNNATLDDVTASELQTLFVGRSAADICEVLNSEYERELQK